MLRLRGELLEAMDSPGLDSPALDRDEFHEFDSQFHVLLSSLASDAAWQKIAGVLRAQHHGTRTAVSDGDGSLAARMLREHIQWFYSESRQP